MPRYKYDKSKGKGRKNLDNKRPESPPLIQDRRPGSPSLTVSFDLSTANKAQYHTFIWSIITEIVIPGEEYLGIYLLEVQPKMLAEKRFMLFDVALVDVEGKKVKLKYRRDNLYLVGYQSGEEKKWIEFNESEPLIPDSQLLKYSGSYKDLQDNGKNILDLKVGKPQIVNAFSALYKPVTEEKIRAISLLTLIIMTSEAVQFKSIKEFIENNFDESKKITEEIRDYINNRKAISKALLESKNQTGLHPKFKDKQDYEKAINSIQVILNVSK